MPPRYAYWTILIGDEPTAFRASAMEDIMPTFNRLKEKQPTAVLRWFQNGKLWPSRIDAREAMAYRGDKGKRGDPRQNTPGSGYQGWKGKPAIADPAGESVRGGKAPRGDRAKPDWKPKADVRPEWKPKGAAAAKPGWKPKPAAFGRGPKPDWKPRAEGGKPAWKPRSEGGKPEWKPKSAAKPEWKPKSAAKPEWKPKSAAKPEWKPKSAAKPEWKPKSAARPDWKPKADGPRTQKPEWKPKIGERPAWKPKAAPRPSSSVTGRSDVRDKKWRPGGEHQDPRQKYKDAKKAKWTRFKQAIRARTGHKKKPE